MKIEKIKRMAGMNTYNLFEKSSLSKQENKVEDKNEIFESFDSLLKLEEMKLKERMYEG